MTSLIYLHGDQFCKNWHSPKTSKCYKGTIMHNTTIFAIIHKVSTTCFGHFWFGHHQVGYNYQRNYMKVKWSRYRSGVAQRVGIGIALLFHDRGSRRGWVVSNTARPHFTPGKDPVPILQESGWTPGPVWTGGKSLPHRDSIPDLLSVVSRYTDWATGPHHRNYIT